MRHKSAQQAPSPNRAPSHTNLELFPHGTGQIVSRIKPSFAAFRISKKHHSTLERHKAFGRKEGRIFGVWNVQRRSPSLRRASRRQRRQRPSRAEFSTFRHFPPPFALRERAQGPTIRGRLLSSSFASHGREGTVSAILRIASDAAGKYAGPSNSSKDAARCCIRVEDAAPVTHSECCEEQASGMQARYRAAHGNLTEYRALLFRLAGGHGVVHK